MYPITASPIRRTARPVGLFVVTSTPEAWWVEKVTAHTEHGAEVLSRWCEAISDRKAYLIATALNNRTQAPTGEEESNDN